MVVAIWGCPQSGKSTVAVNLAVAAAHAGQEVCIISAEDYAEMPSYFGKSNSQKSSLQNVVSSGATKANSLEVAKNIRVIAPETFSDSFNSVLSGTQAAEIIENCRKEFDLIIIDCTSYKTSAITGQGLAMSDKIIMLLSARAITTVWMESNARLTAQLEGKITYVINQTAKNFNYAVLMSVLDKEIPYSIPYVKDMGEYANDGTPVIDELPAKKPFPRAINEILRGVATSVV